MWRVWFKQWLKYLTLSLAGPVLHITFVQYSTEFCSQPDAPSDVISGLFVGPVVPDNRVKFVDPRLNLSREIPPEVV